MIKSQSAKNDHVLLGEGIFLLACERYCPGSGFSNSLPFQGDNKKMEDAKYYLTLPGTKAELEEKELQASKNPSVFTPSKDSTKDSFQIATLICSTKLTQNGRCGVHMNMGGPGLVLLPSLVRVMIPDQVAPGLLRQDAWR